MYKSVILTVFFVVLMTVLLSLTACQQSQTTSASFVISSQVYHNQSLPFIAHVGKGSFANYVAMTINYDAVKPLFLQLQSYLGWQLKHRGEAHITVITPVEYDKVLKPYLSMQTINSMVTDIQHSQFELVCIGRFEKQMKQKSEQTYYLVVKSKDLLQLRQRIANAFVQAGGQAEDFDVVAFYPHITLGFSAQDMHLSDGAYKDSRSCAFPLSVQ